MSIEQQMVCTLAYNPEMISAVTVKPDDFSNRRVGQIFGAVVDLIRDGKEPDLILVAETLNFKNDSDEWTAEVVDCFSQVAVPKNVNAYQRIIKTSRRERRLMGIARGFVQDLETGNAEAVHNILDQVRSVDSEDSELIQSLNSFVPQVVQHIDDVENGLKKTGLSTGLRDLDKLLGGFLPGDQYVLAARTNVGKTAMMVNFAVNIDAPCLVISGEQGGEQITQRVMAKMGGISAYRLRMGRIRQDEYAKLANTAKQIAENQKIFIVDKSRPSIDDIEQLARAAKWRHNIEAVFIDYLQLINHPTEKDKRLQVVDISKRGKELAKELQIPVIMLAQLNRNADGRTPRIADLKESGSIEEDADAIMLLYPYEDNPHRKDLLTVDVQKHRNGPKGHFEVIWNPEFMRADNQ